jgi:hypothetical protein
VIQDLECLEIMGKGLKEIICLVKLTEPVTIKWQEIRGLVIDLIDSLRLPSVAATDG